MAACFSLQRTSTVRLSAHRSSLQPATGLRDSMIQSLADPRAAALHALLREPGEPCRLAAAALWQRADAQEVLCSGQAACRLAQGSCGAASFSPDGKRLALVLEQPRLGWTIQVPIALLKTLIAPLPWQLPAMLKRACCSQSMTTYHLCAHHAGV